MKLVIVESPTKCQTIKKYLGNDYSVIASYGHIRDLATTGKGGLGVAIEEDFKPTYVVNKDKKKTVDALLKEAKKADEIILATDPDREGEAISWHLANVLQLDVKTTKRLEFHEITKSALTHALANPRTIDLDLVASQETRRIIDRIMGFQLSTLLKRKIHSLSAGRVQSVTLRLITEREKEVKAFVPVEYWTIQGLFGDEGWKAKLETFQGEALAIANNQEAEQILQCLEGKTFSVENVKKSIRITESKVPFRTSVLQQEAFHRYKYSTKTTQSYAQRLFELGLITYIRTDGTGYANEFIAHGKAFVQQKFGEHYMANEKRIATLRIKENTKLAHEAIRPTSLELTPASAKSTHNLETGLYNLYKLIYERSLASFMAPKKEEVTTFYFVAESYGFKYEDSTLVFDGYAKVSTADEDKEEKKKQVATYQEHEKVNAQSLSKEQHFTKGPSRFNEARLVKTMEELGIGRPSTYASTISTLYERKYILSEKGTLFPTEQGELTIERLTSYFPDFMDASFTATMEKELDNIGEENGSQLALLKTFYQKFEPLYQVAKENMPGLELVFTGNTCPNCGKPMVLRTSKYGSFEACSGYPECRYVAKKETEPLVYSDKTCPKCGKPLVQRKSKKGEFFACSGYPTCRFIEGQEEKTEEKTKQITDRSCPKCGKPLLLKKGKAGKSDFYACSGFPRCRFIESATKEDKKDEKELQS